MRSQAGEAQLSCRSGQIAPSACSIRQSSATSMQTMLKATLLLSKI